jgi:nitrogen fixation NifU-like protein
METGMDKKLPTHFGRMNDPTASAYVKGACGDEMEFYLVVANDILEEVLFFTANGCDDTKAAGEAAAEMAEGRKVADALGISPGKVYDSIKGDIPEEGRHCSILAVITLHKAIADYLLAP